MTILDIFDNTTVLISGSTEREEVRGYLVKCRDIVKVLAPAAPSPADVTTAYDLAVIPSVRARRKLKLGDAPTAPVPPVDPPGALQAASHPTPEVRLTLLASPGTRLLVEVLPAGAAVTTTVHGGPAAEPSVTLVKEQVDAVLVYEKAVVGELGLLKSYVDTKPDPKNPLPDLKTMIDGLLKFLQTLAP